MLKKRLFQILIVTIALCGFSLTVFTQTAITTSPATRKSSGSINGETYRYKFTQEDFADTPSWNGEEGEPPFSLTHAIAIARTNLPRFVVGAENFKLTRAVLQPTGNDKWFYNISFICRAAVCRELSSRQFSVIVKMDGTILEPKRIVEVN